MHTGSSWKPTLQQFNGIRLFYDRIYGDIYYNPGPSQNQKDALCYSEQLGCFTSLMSYGGT